MCNQCPVLDCVGLCGPGWRSKRGPLHLVLLCAEPKQRLLASRHPRNKALAYLSNSALAHFTDLFLASSVVMARGGAWAAWEAPWSQIVAIRMLVIAPPWLQHHGCAIAIVQIVFDSCLCPVQRSYFSSASALPKVTHIAKCSPRICGQIASKCIAYPTF